VLTIDSTMQADIFTPMASDEGYVGPGFGGQTIRAVIRDIAGTDWKLVAKVDSDELRAPILSAAVRATTFTLFFLLGGAGIAYALWYRRDLDRARRELSLIEDRERGLYEIEASEQRYARVMRGTSDGLWDMNMVTGEVYASPRWREIAGVPPELEVRSQDDMQMFLHPDDVARQRAALAAHLEHGTPYDIELRLRPQPGEPTRWVRTRAEIERNPEGRPIWMSGAITDVTRRRLAEEELQRTARLLRVRTAVNQAIVRADDESALLQMICETLVHDGGYRMAWIGQREDDAERSVRPLAVAGDERGYLTENPVSWGDGPRGQGPTGRCIRSGKPQVAQRLLVEKAFEPWRAAAEARGFASSVAIPLSDGEQTFGALMIYAGEPDAFDQTELELLTALGYDVSFGLGAQRNLESLRLQGEQLKLFRQAIDRSADAIFVADVKTGKFVDFNAACLTQLGYTAEELAALGPADVVVDLEARGGSATIANTVRSAGGVLRPELHRRKDGTEVPVEVALSVLDLGPRTLILGIARDISDRLSADADRQSLQEMLNRAQKMESIGRLAGGVAHDFNNLLTVINASAELAMREAPDDSSVQRDLQEIRAAGDRAAALTRQLLAFSRQQVLRREVLSLNGVVTGFLTLLNRVIGEDIKVEVRLGPDVPNIIADANQLEQVLMNLSVNARDAMPRGGTLTIGTGAADIDDTHAATREGLSPGRYATLSVTDTGVGMDEHTQAKIFEPFFTTKETGRGTGLGLATVYGIVKQTGGSIYVYSELGRGTMFLIYLPITSAEIEVPVTEKTEAPSVGKETILLVEDEDSIRLVARRVLQHAGYTVLEAESGPAALELYKRHTGPLDLVLTDLVMPGMSGIELAAELRKLNPALKFLFASGYSAEAVAEEFVHEGEWNFIGKPYGLRELTAEIRRILDR
jgi:PAS domain S-box-containing protein